MPYYEYRCDANGRTVEVRHGMNDRLSTWGEVVDAAGLDLGNTPADTPVQRLMSVTSVGSAGSDGSAAGPDPGFGGCGPGCACANQA